MILNKLKKAFKANRLYLQDFIGSINSKKRYTVVNYSSDALSYTRSYYFTKFFKSTGYKFSTYKPSIAFFETHGNRTELEKSDAKIKIFFSGENVHSDVSPTARLYEDYCLDLVDLYDYLNKSNYIRFPLWLEYFFSPKADKDQIKKMVDDFNSRTFNKTEFCSLVAAHDKTGVRQNLLAHVNKIGQVHCPGKFAHNDDTLSAVYNDDKALYLNRYRFNLCPENDAFHGYVTEKIFQAFWSDCIPIYWGADTSPEPCVINPDSFIFFDRENPFEAMEKIRLLETNEKLYSEFKRNPRLCDGATDWIFSTMSQLQDKIDQLLISKDLQ